MSGSTTTDDGEGRAGTDRRKYDSPVRRERMGVTRERIVSAGAELAHRSETWEWKDLTFRAVAARAGVGERTVYRHFPTERDLRDAIMARLAEEAGVDYDGVTLATVAEVAGRVLRSLGSFVAPTFTAPTDPTLVAVDQQRREALQRAVAAETPDWSPGRRRTLAAVLDVLWGPPSLERLVSGWGMDVDEAIEVLAWAIDRLAAPAADDRPPGRDRTRERPPPEG
jgi:AcrR family transcriptional regulator